MTPEPSSRWQRTWTLLRRWPALGVVPLVLLVAGFGQATVLRAPIVCVFRLTTGLPCAGCGLTRAFLALSHGHLQAALDFNLLSPFVFVWMLAWWLVAIVAVLRGRDVPDHPRWLPRLGLIVVVSYWIGRVAWFVLQPHPWQQMVTDSPVMRLVDGLLRRIV